MSFALSAQVMHEFVAQSVVEASTMLVPRWTTEDPEPGPRAVPRPLRQWLARLRLLEGVPFSHLVPHAALLPPESIRFFVVDRTWTDALVEGALGVGTVTTAEKAALEALYPTVRGEVDEEERLVRLPGWTPGTPVPGGAAGTISGLLLRSALVSGWPALHVRAYGRDPAARGVGDKADADDVADRRLVTLRMERLAPAVLLVLFDGMPAVVHLEEPRVGVQFGVTLATTNDVQNGFVPPRDAATASDLPDPSGTKRVRVRFRRGGPGVIHLARLDAGLRAVPGTNMGTDVDSAEFALQMLRFPFRAVFGDQGANVPDDAVFAPQVSTLALRQVYARVLSR